MSFKRAKCHRHLPLCSWGHVDREGDSGGIPKRKQPNPTQPNPPAEMPRQMVPCNNGSPCQPLPRQWQARPSYRVVRERRQHNDLLQGVHHDPPELFQHPLQHSLLTDIGKEGQAAGKGEPVREVKASLALPSPGQSFPAQLPSGIRRQQPFPVDCGAHPLPSG